MTTTPDPVSEVMALLKKHDDALITWDCDPTEGTLAALHEAFNVLRAKIRELERDAARYRWLRGSAPISSRIGPLITQGVYINGVFQNRHDILCLGDADAAIDSARGTGEVK